MSLTYINSKKIRKSFGKIPHITPLPNLIEVQKRSFDNFLQLNINPEDRLNNGLHAIFKSVFPINDYTERATVDYVSYDIGVPKYDVEECSQRGMTFGAPLLVNFRLIVWDIDEDAGTKSVRDIKEQEVYMGDIPLMTKNATFVINGIERVVVSQMHRSPGVFFDHDKGKTHASGKLLFNCRVIPNRGSWLDFEYDVKDFLYFRIDRKKKILASTLLLALGYSKSDMVNEFYEKENFMYDSKIKKWKTKFNPENYKTKNFYEEVVDAKTGKVLIALGEKVNFLNAKKLFNDGLKEIYVKSESLYGKFLHKDIIIGEETFDIGVELNDTILQQIIDANISSI